MFFKQKSNTTSFSFHYYDGGTLYVELKSVDSKLTFYIIDNENIIKFLYKIIQLDISESEMISSVFIDTINKSLWSSNTVSYILNGFELLLNKSQDGIYVSNITRLIAFVKESNKSVE